MAKVAEQKHEQEMPESWIRHGNILIHENK